MAKKFWDRRAFEFSQAYGENDEVQKIGHETMSNFAALLTMVTKILAQ